MKATGCMIAWIEEQIIRTGCLIEIDIDSFQLQVWCSTELSSWINAMFVRDDFPELHYTKPRSSVFLLFSHQQYMDGCYAAISFHSREAHFFL